MSGATTHYEVLEGTTSGTSSHYEILKALRVFLQDIKSHELLRYIVVLQERRGNTRGDNWLNMAK